MSFTIHLKSGERYEFHKIRTVKMEDTELGKFITVNGNFKKQGKYKNLFLWRRIIKNIKAFEKWLTSTMKLYLYDGACPKCESLKLTRFENHKISQKLNDYKKSIQVVEKNPIHTRCNECKHIFTTQGLKYVSTMVYYK